jgi:hypothetical protein
MKKRNSLKKTKRQSKPKPSDKVYNIYHPELSDKIEASVNQETGKPFIVNGVQYYNFKRDTEVRTGRYMILTNFLQEVNYRMDLERLKMYIKRIRSELDNSRGQINVGNAVVFLDQMMNLTTQAFEAETIYRLASAIYFDDTEDLRTWDKEHNEKKISGWKEDGTLDFFFSRPFKELIDLRSTSETDIRASLDAVARLNEEYKSVLSSETQ